MPKRVTFEYVLDSSALFDLKDNYPEHIFPGVWEKFNAICSSLSIIAPKEVYRELKKGNDLLVQWVEDYDKIFFEPCDEEIEIFQEIMKVYPEKTIAKYSMRCWADPFVIAAAKYYNVDIIQHETPDNSQTKLPSVAKLFGAQCYRLTEFFDRESWRFG